MSREKDLIKNTSILMIAKISTQIISFLLLPLYTALLTTAQYGQVDIYTSLAMIIIPFLTLQTEMGLFRFFIASHDTQKKSEIVSSTISIIIKCVIVFTVCFIALTYMIKIQYALLLYGYYLSMMISTVLLQMCRAEGDNISYGVATFLSSTVSVLLNILFVAILTLGVSGILLSTIIAQTISIGYMIYKTKIYRYYSRLSINKQEERKILNYSYPLVFNQVSSWAVNYSDRIIILLFWGNGANGIYSIANKFSNITNTFFGVYNVAWTENVVRNIDDQDSKEYISHIFNLTFSLYLILITGIVNLLPFFFNIMVNEAYASSYHYVPFLLLGMFFSGMAATLGSIFIAKNKTKDVSLTTAMAGICNVVIHLVMVKQYKLYAAAVSTLISFGLLFVYRYIFVNRFFSVNYNIKKIMPYIIAFLFAWVAYSSKNYILIFIGCCINFINITILGVQNLGLLKSILKK